ncbi:MAG: hypothetical protein ACI8ZM_002598 [Crocinitomix sp.]|jgi:hypothetical protein
MSPQKLVKKSYLFILLMPFFSGLGWSQSFQFQFDCSWENEGKRCVPCSYNDFSQEVSTSTTKQIKLRGNYDFTYTVDAIIYEEIDFPSYFNKSQLPSTANIEVTFGTTQNENYVTAQYNPIVYRGGRVEIVKEVKLSVQGIMRPLNQDRAVDFAAVSVLASGDWYKIGVQSDGVFRIDYDDLSELGIPVGSINPNSINIYGNHIPEISHDNSSARPDDLVKNAIRIVGEADFSFDSEDYILFYAKGPENLAIDATVFKTSKNRIDSLAYYFIHVDNADSPKRLTAIANSSSPFTNDINSFNTYTLHEVNAVNSMKSGDRWFGEHFEGAQLSHNFTLNAENRDVSQPVYLETQFGSKSRSGTSELLVNINGLWVDTLIAETLTGDYRIATVGNSESNFISGTENFDIELQFNRTSPASEAWLDFLKFNYIKKLQMGVNPLIIRDLRTVGLGNVNRYNVSNSSANTAVWEVTDPYNVKSVSGTLSGINYSFIHNADSVRTYVAFNNSQLKSPVLSGRYLGKIDNQNLHGFAQADYLIITHESLHSQAERLANLHRGNGLTVHVVDIQKVYNEFGGGAADPVAIRWFAKMFYDRVAIDPDNTLKYLCLFGDGTYDPLNRIPNNNYLLPTYNSPPRYASHESITDSFTSDDFFGLLDDDEVMKPTDMLDVGVGRIPVSDLEVAEQVVDKIQHYMQYGSNLYENALGAQCDSEGHSSSFGDWRNRVVIMADDIDDVGADTGFVGDCEDVSDYSRENHPEMNFVKIYLGAYKQIATSGGERYPDVEEAINQNMNKGALIFNYVGHGGETGLALERVVSIPMIRNWLNINNMPIFISATCEFSRFDDPGRISAGEITLTTPYGGAVGLLTTTRAVSTHVNGILVRNLYKVLFNEEEGEPLALGEIIRQAKNLTLLNNHMRHFALLGDPALKLGKANPRIITDEINGIDIELGVDTLKALSKITIKGHIEDVNGNILTDYNGVVFPTVLDKWKDKKTLGQNSEGIVQDFTIQNNIVYKGKSTVKNGYFSYTFVVPKDIDYTIGKGKLSYYSNTNVSHNYGFDTTVVVGGINPNGIEDDLGPEIELFMNDEQFVNGGLTNANPTFLAHIQDENGINTTGNGIGHDITIIIDANSADPIVLNNFYEADLDTYQSGKVSYLLSELEEGTHQIVFKVWDVNNNSAEQTLDFIVIKEEEIGISHLLNYPNPFTTNTDFYFEHNQVCNSLNVRVEVFTVSGKLVKTIIETVHSTGFRSNGINWDGRDDYGDKIGRGVYVYRLSIETEQGKKAEKIEKLVIL